MRVSGVVRLARDIELKYLPSGMTVASFSVVSSEKYKEEEKACFIDAVAFGKTAEIMNQFLRKGSQVYIIGKLNQESWEKDGQKRSKHTITVENMELIGKKEDNAPQPQKTQPQPQQPQHEVDISEDEIPF